MGQERLPLRYQLLITAPTRPHAARDVLAALVTQKPRTRRERLRNGMVMEILLPDYTSIYVRMKLAYEPDVTAFIEKVTKLGDTFLDIGAHFGYHSLMAASMVGENGRVVAFEPTPSTFEVLGRNAAQCTNITTENLAVNDGSSNQAQLQDFGAIRCGANTITPEARIPQRKKQKLLPPVIIQIPAVSIDKYLDAQPELIPPSVIKIDAENAEMAILRGAANTIRRHTPAIILECGDLGRTPDISTKTCLHFLGARGYVFYGYDFRKKKIHDCLLDEIINEDYSNILGVHLQKAF